MAISSAVWTLPEALQADIYDSLMNCITDNRNPLIYSDFLHLFFH
jgi:hypothetical protein